MFSKLPEWDIDPWGVGPHSLLDQIESRGFMSDIPLFFERLNRRSFLGASALGAASVALSACTTTEVVTPPPVAAPPSDPAFGDTATMYTARIDEGYQLPAIPVAKIDPKFVRQIVSDPTGEKPGTIVVDVSEHFLYLVREAARPSAMASASARPASDGPAAPWSRRGRSGRYGRRRRK